MVSRGTTGDEHRVADTFVRLVDTLAGDYQTTDLLQFLVERCAELVVADTAGLLLEAGDGDLKLAAAVSEEMHDIEQVELSTGEGPCMDAYRAREVVAAPDLAAQAGRWPAVVPRLLDMGMRSGYAFPMRLRDDCIGALNIYRRSPGALDEEQTGLAQAFAEIAAIGILQQRRASVAEERAAQLQLALDSRVLIEQAKGMLAQHHGISPDEAFGALRRYARQHRQGLQDVSRRLVGGELDPVPLDARPSPRRTTGRGRRPRG